MIAIECRGPYDWGRLLAHFAARAVEGVERIQDGAYARGSVCVRFAAGHLETTGEPERVRRMFDADTNVAAMAEHLRDDALLAPLVARRPGLRIPGAWDGFELAVRAVLGQQVTLGAARRLARALVDLCGGGCFPDAADVLRADLARMPMPCARQTTLLAIAEAAAADPGVFDAPGRLPKLRGVGEWTAQYIALRAARDRDAFPASDIGLLRGAATMLGYRPEPKELLRRAEAWRPYRAYAAQHLWAADAETEG